MMMINYLKFCWIYYNYLIVKNAYVKKFNFAEEFSLLIVDNKKYILYVIILLINISLCIDFAYINLISIRSIKRYIRNKPKAVSSSTRVLSLLSPLILD